MSSPRTVAFHTLGCKLNFSETSTLARSLEEAGYAKVREEERPDVFVLNTCSVTENADKECRRHVRRFQAINPEAFIAVVGCYAQLKPQDIAAIPGVDLVLGANEKFDLAAHIDPLLSRMSARPRTGTGPHQGRAVFSPIKEVKRFIPSYNANDRTRTFLKVQDGCDYFCSFCTIPLARGRSRSATIAETVAHARTIAASGVQEIVLTGVNTGDFGKSTSPGSTTMGKEDFLGLIHALDEVEGIARFRISSIEPNLCHDGIIDLVANSKRFAPHFHLPLQSGSDVILERMRRRYDTALYADRVYRIKERMPYACIGVDVITGTPGETEEEFLRTHAFLRSIPVDYLHVFTYSERANTTAVRMDEAVPMAVRRERTKQLRILSSKLQRAFYERHVGSTRPVLFEHGDGALPSSTVEGYTDNYLRVSIPFDAMVMNTVVPVTLERINGEGQFTGPVGAFRPSEPLIALIGTIGMYPTIYHALLDLTGIDLPFLRFMNSFGFFVALAFVVASWTLSLELRRRERSGLLKTSVRRITVGAAATPLELLTNAAIGFVLGFKALYLLLNFERATADPQAFLLSGMGSLIGGLLGAGLLAYLKWHEKNKAKLATPKVEEIRMQPSDHANNITLTAALWGIIGAKLFHWLENPDEFVHFIQDPSGDKIFSGLTMYGGSILAGAMVMRYFKLHGIPVWQGADSAAPGVMIAYGIGRIGCQVSGDGDWGIVNTTFLGPGPKWFWQYDYPNNVNSVGVALIDGRPCFDGYCTVLPETVWPTPLYETIVSVALFFLLWSLRERLRPAGMIFFLYLFLNGLERFFIEKIRVNVEVFGHITQAEIISTVLMIVGIGGMLWLRKTKNYPMNLEQLTKQVESIRVEIAAFIREEAPKFTEAEVNTKSANNLVTHVDHTAEDRIVEALEKLLPNAGFIAEEGSGEQGVGLNWIIDPLDGTTNFVHGVPCYCISIALVDGTEPLLGVVHEVTRDERFTAWKGGGAYLNGKPIRVSARKELQDSLLATGFPYDDFGYEAEYMDLLRELMHRTRGIRRLGSAAADLAYVACGRFEAFYEYGLNSWDVAAGVLLVREAGGKVSGFLPSKDPVFDEEIVASNSAIHDELLEVIERNWQRQDS